MARFVTVMVLAPDTPAPLNRWSVALSGAERSTPAAIEIAPPVPAVRPIFVIPVVLFNRLSSVSVSARTVLASLPEPRLIVVPVWSGWSVASVAVFPIVPSVSVMLSAVIVTNSVAEAPAAVMSALPPFSVNDFSAPSPPFSSFTVIDTFFAAPLEVITCVTVRL